MNTEIIAHPRLQHYGLITANLEAMLDWYRKTLGMTVRRRAAPPPEARGRAPFTAFAFVGNDEWHHRIVFFESRDATVDADKRRHTGLQHVAFEYATLDDLLGSYIRLKGLEMLPIWAADHGVGVSIYYEDPDRNVVELSASNYPDIWTATEHMHSAPPTLASIDPEKIVAARTAGASPWDLHKRAVAGEFAPEKSFDPRGLI